MSYSSASAPSFVHQAAKPSLRPEGPENKCSNRARPPAGPGWCAGVVGAAACRRANCRTKTSPWHCRSGGQWQTSTRPASSGSASMRAASSKSACS
eukprot:6885965-Lingulodinium_polyedra.AAC.1